uniref:Uncharacterized protein n=1 Tax=viral metagenome TaxID=1070528 RepID=A0A6M3LH18_9ZZZZ
MQLNSDTQKNYEVTLINDVQDYFLASMDSTEPPTLKVSSQFDVTKKYPIFNVNPNTNVIILQSPKNEQLYRFNIRFINFHKKRNAQLNLFKMED